MSQALVFEAVFALVSVDLILWMCTNFTGERLRETSAVNVAQTFTKLLRARVSMSC